MYLDFLLKCGLHIIGGPIVPLSDKPWTFNYKMMQKKTQKPHQIGDSPTEGKNICWHLEQDYMTDGLQVCSAVLWYHIFHTFVVCHNCDRYLWILIVVVQEMVFV